MDPLSIAAGVTGFVGLAMKITKILRTYTQDFRDHAEDAKALTQEVEVLHKVLQQFANLVKTDTNWHCESKYAIYKLIRSCRDTIEKLHDKLENMKPNFLGRVTWPFSKEEYRGTLATLQ
jgi:uncharacterized protein (DUF342 family)